MDSNLNHIKKHVFFEFMNLAGRVFVLVRYSDNVILGSRGFTAEEKENGIVLVFNSRMNFLWDDYGITVTLVFGTSPQKCFIPLDDIIAVYSPELNAQFVTSPQLPTVNSQQPAVIGQKERVKGQGTSGKGTSKNVIQVDFTKKRK